MQDETLIQETSPIFLYRKTPPTVDQRILLHTGSRYILRSFVLNMKFTQGHKKLKITCFTSGVSSAESLTLAVKHAAYHWDKITYNTHKYHQFIIVQ